MKKLKYFVNVDPIDESGAVAWSSFIEADQVIEAYENGIFPWPDKEKSTYWFSPLQRGVLDFKDLKWTRKELKFFKTCEFDFKINYDFRRFIKTCAQVKAETEKGTWITKQLISAYLKLNQTGEAISFEVYDQNELVGGLYGVLSKTYFSAESMFYIKPNASKYALYKTVEFLSSKGLTWMDTQVVTEFTSRIGAKEISRKDFLKRIES